VESWRRQQCDAVRFCSRSLLALASFSLARPLDSIIALACLQSSLARLSLCQFPPPSKPRLEHEPATCSLGARSPIWSIHSIGWPAAGPPKTQ